MRTDPTPATDGTTVAVTVLLPSGATDLRLASGVPVGAIVDRLAADHLLPPAQPWQLATSTGRSLRTERTLDDEGIRPGDYLIAEPQIPTDAPVLDDVDETVDAAGGPAWPRSGPAAAALVAAGPVALSALGLAAANLGTGAALGAALLACFVVGWLAWAGRELPVAPTVLLVATTAGAGATVSRVTGQPPRITLLVVWGCFVGAALLAHRLVRDTAAAAAVCALILPGGVAALLAATTDRAPTDLAAVVALIGAAQLLAAPRIGLTVGRLARWVDDPKAVRTGAATAHGVTAGLTAGSCAAMAAGGMVTALDGAAGLALAAAASVVVLLRMSGDGRRVTALPQAIVAVLLTATVAFVAAIRPSAASVPALIGLAGMVSALVSGLLASATASWRRRCERLAAAALIPLTVAVCGGLTALLAELPG